VFLFLDVTHRAADEQEVDVTTIREAYTRCLGHLHVDDFARVIEGDRFDLEGVILR
jgi:hypothetical protein